MAAETSPSWKTERAGEARNLGKLLKNSGAKQIIVRAAHMTFVNAAAALTSEVLNFYLESRGLNQRRIAIISAPNPDRPAPVNPLKRTF
jgi:hypothetical protein